jgi:hypothetical protein
VKYQRCILEGGSVGGILEMHLGEFGNVGGLPEMHLLEGGGVDGIPEKNRDAFVGGWRCTLYSTIDVDAFIE